MKKLNGCIARCSIVDKNISYRNYLVLIVVFIGVMIYLLNDYDNSVFSVENIRLQLFLLLVFSFVISLFFFLFANQTIVFNLYIMNTLLIILISGLYVNAVGLRLWIVSALFYQYSVKFPFKVSILASMVLFIILIPIQTNTEVFGFYFNALSFPELLILLMSELVMLFLCHYIKYNSLQIKQYLNNLKQKMNYIESLVSTNLKFQKHAFRVENESRIEERLNITREIHDITGYTLTSIVMMLEYAEDLLYREKVEELQELLKHVRQQARTGHNDIRQALKQLRDIQEVSVPLSSRVYKIVQNFMNATGLQVRLEFTNFSTLDNDTYDNFILRFIQEGLTNSFRHGRATNVSIIFFQDVKYLNISIEDNGVGSDNIIEGIGLKGMAERIEQHGGTLTYDSSKEGFSLIAKLPRL